MVVFISLLGRSVDLLATLRSKNTELIFGQRKYFFLPENVTYEIFYTIVLASLENFFSRVSFAKWENVRRWEAPYGTRLRRIRTFLVGV